MSTKAYRKTAQEALRILFERVSAAQGLVEQDSDQCIDVLELLAEARRTGSQGIVALKALCLEEQLGAVRAGLEGLTTEEIDKPFGLAEFCLLNLCFPCREEIDRCSRPGRARTRTRVVFLVSLIDRGTVIV